MTQSNIGVTLDGVCTWQLLSGSEVVQQSTQHNLLLDAGLDNIGTYGLVDPYKYACVGTGTSEPAVTQTSLDAEVARALTRPSGYSDNPQYQNPGVYRLEIVREFSEASVANQNLTEWGFSPVSQGGVGVRERFRDDQGDPVTLTPDGSQKLRLTYEVTVTLTPVTPTPCTVTVQGAGAATTAGTDDLQGQYSLHGLAARAFVWDNDFDIISATLKGSSMYFGVASASDNNALSYGEEVSLAYRIPSPERFNPPAYVVGSFEREFGSVTIGATTYQGEVRYLVISVDDDQQYQTGFVTEFDPDHRIQKDDLHTLTIEGPIISWSRA